MADCYAPEAADDLHRRWLPREIFADIGIVDPEHPADAAQPTAAEELAAQVAGILGTGGSGTGGGMVKPPPPPFAPPVAAPCQRAPVCGMEGPGFVTLLGGGGGSGSNVVATRGAAVARPVTPYSPVHQWQVPSSIVNVGGMLQDYSSGSWVLPPPSAKPRGGTGVFLPRADAYSRHAPPPPPPPPPAKDVTAPSLRRPAVWRPPPAPAVQQPQQQQRKKEHAAAAGRRAAVQQRQWRQRCEEEEVAAEVRWRARASAAAASCSCSEAAVALPQEWSYQL